MPHNIARISPDINSLPDYITGALKRVGLSRRKYQETACLETLRLFKDDQNAEINLPPGTGKTLIAQIVGCIWIREREQRGSNKVLCILPSSTLREQHHTYCTWWAGEAGLCTPL